MNVTVIGAGYVGLVTGVCLSDVGFNVTILENDTRKLDMLNNGESPIYEPGIKELMERNVGHERLCFTNNIGKATTDANFIFIAVGTPENEDGSADLTYVKEVSNSLGKILTNNCIVVVKSTVPVGSCDIVESIIFEELNSRNLNISVDIVSNPEFLKEGSAISDFLKPDRIVVGVNSDRSIKEIRKLYAPFIRDDPGKLLFMKRKSSEMTKYASNSMLATRITFMNELSQLCDVVGADINEIRIGMGKDSRIGKSFLFAGPGYGGSCFPKDVKALMRTGRENNVPMELVNATERANFKQIDYAFNKVYSFYKNDLANKKIAIWGLSFKPGTDDIREAPSLKISKKLLDHGASLKVHDPKAMNNFKKNLSDYENEIKYLDEAYDALNDCDALILLTEWKEYQKPNWNKVSKLLKNKVVFDFRNQYSNEELPKLGYFYFGIGLGTTETGEISDKLINPMSSKNNSLPIS